MLTAAALGSTACDPAMLGPASPESVTRRSQRSIAAPFVVEVRQKCQEDPASSATTRRITPSCGEADARRGETDLAPTSNRVHRWRMPSQPTRRLAFTRDISPAIENCELTHLERTTIDLTRARAEHNEYEAALRALGYEVKRLPSGPDMPDSVFIEDAAIVLDELAVIMRPGADSRRVETTAVAEAVKTYRPVAAILAPGTIDGGDVLRIGRRLYVGVGYRSNDGGVKQLGAIVSSQGYSVEAVQFQGCLHLKSAVTLVADDMVLINPEWVDADRFQPLRTIDVDPSEPYAANALLIDGTVVYPAEHVRTRKRLEAAGLTVHPVPAGELAKAEGGVTCCSLLLIN